MEVILKEDYPGLGKKGQVVDVAKGYARNYLIPRNLALLNVAGNKSAVKAELQFDEIRQKKDKAAAEEIKGKIDGKELTVKAKVGKEGKLYGSVTKQDIVDLLKKDGFEIDKKILDIDDHIKEAGSYDIQVNLFKDVKANIKLIVEGESEEEEEESDEEKKDIDTDEKEE
ncbi:MAG: 50S ribosomal protein L9, partial [candidate division WOR-3 bacterium]